MINPKPRPCEAATIASRPANAICPAPDRKWVLAAAVIASTMSIVDESVVNIALPRIQTELLASLPTMQWVENAYTLCMSALLLIGGAAADQFGRRRVFLIGIAIFAAASLACGLAGSAEQLIGARVIQGMGAGLLVPSSLAIIGASFSEEERGVAIGIWSACSAIAAGLGPLLGGSLVDHGSWRAIFLINPALALPAIWITLRHLPESRDPHAAGGLDWTGAVLTFAGLGSVVYALIAAATLGWRNPLVLGALAAGVVLLTLFVLVERRLKAPMMPFELFRSRGFSGVNLLTLLLYAALGGAFFFLPFVLIQAHGFSATAAGAVFLPFTLTLGLLSRWSGGLADRYGARWPLVLGPAIAAVGFGLLAFLDQESQRWFVLLPLTVQGLGLAITVTPLTTAVLNCAPPERSGVASGINNAVASVASLLAVAVFGAIAIGVFDRSIDSHLASETPSADVRQVVESVRGKLLVPPLPADLDASSRKLATSILADAYDNALHELAIIAAALALASSVVGFGSFAGKPLPNPSAERV